MTEAYNIDGFLYKSEEDYEDDNIKIWHYAAIPGHEFEVIDRSPYLVMTKEDFAKFVDFYKNEGRWPTQEEARTLEEATGTLYPHAIDRSLDKFYAERDAKSRKMKFKFKHGDTAWCAIDGVLQQVRAEPDINSTSALGRKMYLVSSPSSHGSRSAREDSLYSSKEQAERAIFKKKLAKESKEMDKQIQDILRLAGVKTTIVEADVEQNAAVDDAKVDHETNQEGEESPLTHSSEEVAKMHPSDAPVEEAMGLDEEDMEEDFLAPPPSETGKYDVEEEGGLPRLGTSGFKGMEDDAGHECTAAEIGHCEHCGAWMDPAGGMHDANEENPAKMYEGFTDEHLPEVLSNNLLKKARRAGAEGDIQTQSELERLAELVRLKQYIEAANTAIEIRDVVPQSIYDMIKVLRDKHSVEEAKKKAPVAKNDDEDEVEDSKEKIVDVGDDEDYDNFDFESEFDKSMGNKGMFEMNELRKLAGLEPVLEDKEQDKDEDKVDWNKEVEDFRKRREPDTGKKGFAAKIHRGSSASPSGKIYGLGEEAVTEVFADQQDFGDDVQAFEFDNEKAYYFASDFLGADMDFGPNDEILVPAAKADRLCDALLSNGFVHGKDFTELSGDARFHDEEVEEDLQNGYNDHHVTNGVDHFPKGATSQPAGDLGPGGAKAGDNPMSTRMKTVEDKIYENFKLAYRRFRRGK